MRKNILSLQRFQCLSLVCQLTIKNGPNPPHWLVPTYGGDCKQILSGLKSGALKWGGCLRILSGLKSGAHLWRDCFQILSGLKSRAHLWGDCKQIWFCLKSGAHLWGWGVSRFRLV
jgi:hypothetical protein